MDTLVWSATTLLLPVHLAAVRRHWLLMHHVMLLALTSWAHHAVVHAAESDAVGRPYHVLDRVVCRTVILHTAALAWAGSVHAYWPFLAGVAACYTLGVRTNADYCRRGLRHWRCHVAHIGMHLCACGGICMVA